MTTETISQPQLPRQIPLCSYAFVTEQPEGLSFADWSLPPRNDEPDSDYVTATFGINAGYQSHSMAKQQAEADGTVSMKLSMKFLLRGGIPKIGLIATVRAARVCTMVAEAHLSKHVLVSAGSFH